MNEAIKAILHFVVSRQFFTFFTPATIQQEGVKIWIQRRAG